MILQEIDVIQLQNLEEKILAKEKLIGDLLKLK